MALDQAIEVLDPRFYALVIHNTHLECLWTGARWMEGPAYVPSARHLIFSDIPNDRTLRFDERTENVDVFEEPSFNANGHCLDLQGRIVTAEHRGRAVTRIGHDGHREILVDQYQGQRLNSPNDVVVRSDGSIWFTDPTYGIDTDYEGDIAESEIGECFVYRLAPDGTMDAVIRDMTRPNGLAFSPDETTLYVADTGRSHVGSKCPQISVRIRSQMTGNSYLTPIRSLPRAPAECLTDFESIDKEIFGPQLATVCIATRLMGP